MSVVAEFVGGPRDGEQMALEEQLASFRMLGFVADGIEISQEIGRYCICVWLDVPKGQHGITYYRWEGA